MNDDELRLSGDLAALLTSALTADYIRRRDRERADRLDHAAALGLGVLTDDHRKGAPP